VEWVYGELGSVNVWAIVVTFVVCQFLYLFSNRFFSKNQISHLSSVDLIDLQSRSASTVHSVIVFVIILYVVLSDAFGDQQMLKDPVNAHRPETTFAMCIGLGYFISDFLLVMILQLPPILPMFFHHVFAIGAFVSLILFKKLEFFVCLLYLAEGANPWYNLWWLCSRKIIKNNSLYLLAGKLFGWSWVFCRLALKPVVWYKLYQAWPPMPSFSTQATFLSNENLTNNYTEMFWYLKETWIGWSPSESCLTFILINAIFLTFFDFAYFSIGPHIPLIMGVVDAPDSFGVFGDPKTSKEKKKKNNNQMKKSKNSKTKAKAD